MRGLLVLLLGTQQLDLRKVSLGSNTRAVSLQEALNQLQSTIKLVGADKRYVYNWVLNLMEMVSQSTSCIHIQVNWGQAGQNSLVAKLHVWKLKNSYSSMNKSYHNICISGEELRFLTARLQYRGESQQEDAMEFL